ncbi:MAG: hypothetical protein ABJH72_15920 [Reichenbachiella sp.]
MNKVEIYQIMREVLSGSSEAGRRELLNHWLEESKENLQIYNAFAESLRTTRNKIFNFFNHQGRV